LPKAVLAQITLLSRGRAPSMQLVWPISPTVSGNFVV